MPEIPESLAYLFLWYNEVRGQARLTWSEMESWSRMTGRNLAAWEAEVIKMLDDIRFEVKNV